MPATASHVRTWGATKTHNRTRLHRAASRPAVKSVTATEVVRSFGGRLTYRMLDYWVRTGIIQIEGNPGGSGNRRMFTPDEIAALDDLIEIRATTLSTLDKFSSGELFAERLRARRKVTA